MLMFRVVRFKNLLSSGNYWTEIKLDTSSNTLVIGVNGSGKSTFLDAICFSLFGKAFRNINKPQLLNSINQHECVVETEFDINNKSYKIVRGMKPNVFEIYCNGIMLNQDAASRDYQDYLEKSILKLNYKSFTQIVILGAASFTPFMQLSAADRRAIIEDLLDIQIFTQMNNIAKSQMQQNKDDTTTNKFKIELVTEKITMQENHLTNMEKSTKARIASLKVEIKEHKKKITEYKVQKKEKQNTLSSMHKLIADKVGVEKKIKSLTQLEAQIEQNIKKLRGDERFFQNNDSCPTCHQGIPEEFKISQIGDAATKITQSTLGLGELQEKMEEYQIRLSDIEKINKDIIKCQQTVVVLDANISNSETHISTLEAKIKLLESEKKPDLVAKIHLINLKTELEEYEKTRERLVTDKAYLEACSLLLKDNGIKTKIVRQYLPIINKVVNKHLASLDFFVNFTLDENFKETIKSRHRDEFTYESFSEGEKSRIDMSLMLTWRAIAKIKNSSNTNLLILDEVFDSSLDANGTEYLMNILHILEGVNLFVISHKSDLLVDKFSNVIRFNKVNNFSYATI